MGRQQNDCVGPYRLRSLDFILNVTGKPWTFDKEKEMTGIRFRKMLRLPCVGTWCAER